MGYRLGWSEVIVGPTWRLWTTAKPGPDAIVGPATTLRLVAMSPGPLAFGLIVDKTGHQMTGWC